MADKPKEPPKDAPADKDKPAEGDAAAKPAAAASPVAAFIPLIAAVVLAPALSWAVAQFVLMPQLKKQLALPPGAAHAPADPHAAPAEAEAPEEPAEEKGGHGGGHGKKEGGKEAGPGNTYEFENVVVNLAGTMGTRYLKTAFLVTGTDKSLRASFEKNKPKLVDVTLGVLSSLTLPDLEEAGSKNFIREKLIAAYNQALGKKIVEQIYFSDFVVQ